MKKINYIIRTGLSNNFNCTKSEYKQLSLFGAQYNTFVNSNVKSVNKVTAKNINKFGYKIVITINPDLKPNFEYIEKLKLIDKNLVSFVRLKYLPDYNIESLYDILLKLGYKVVITNQRFKSFKSLSQFIKPGNQYKYHWVNGWYRLKDKYLPKFRFICDKKHKGCQVCSLCSVLTFNCKTNIFGLNLSSSGYCKFNCPDCFAKINSIRAKGLINFDQIKQNTKQSGKLYKVKK